MDVNVDDLTTANDKALTTSTLNLLQSWPHVDLTSWSHVRWHAFYLNNWSQPNLAGPIQHHGPFPSQPFQTHTWNCKSQEQTNNQLIRSGARQTRQPGPLTVAIPHGEVLSPYNIGVPTFDGPRVYQSTDTAHSDVVSQKPNHYSEPVVWTPAPYETCCPNPNDTLSPMNTEIVSSSGEETNTTGRMTGSYPGSLPSQEKQRMCFDHGCNGRKFSSISNLRRHQRERAGRTPLSFCCWCGAAFYRRWTRDQHVMRISCLGVTR